MDRSTHASCSCEDIGTFRLHLPTIREVSVLDETTRWSILDAHYPEWVLGIYIGRVIDGCTEYGIDGLCWIVELVHVGSNVHSVGHLRDGVNWLY